MKACIGGTFDHLHKGHKRFLDKVFEQADTVFVGITSDSFAKSLPLADKVQHFEERKKALKDYLYSAGYLDRATIEEINDIFGPATKASDLEAIFCTSKTKENSLKLNEERMKVALRPLRVIEVDLVEGEDENPISSEQIRAGEINTEGKKVPEPEKEEEEEE